MTDKRRVTVSPPLPVVHLLQAFGRAPEHFEGTGAREFLKWVVLYRQQQRAEWEFLERRKRYSRALGC